jgi:hypothetical protein
MLQVFDKSNEKATRLGMRFDLPKCSFDVVDGGLGDLGQ